MKFGYQGRKQIFEIVFRLKSDKRGLTFTFHFLFFPLFSLCLPLFFLFFSAGHLVDFILVGKVFGKALGSLGLDDRKGRWVVEQGFYVIYQT